MEEYPNNSYKHRKEQADKAEKTEKKKVEKVVTGPVKQKKKSEMSKIMEMFLPEDVTNVKDYVIMDVVIPTVKDTIIRVVEMMLGVDSRDSHKRASGAPKISYWGRFDERDRRDPRDRGSRSRSSYEAEEYAITSRAEAEDVLSQMDDMIRQYGVVSIGDYNELLGVRGSYTDQKYGWTSLRTADIVRVRDGWVIKLPKAMPID